MTPKTLSAGQTLMRSYPDERALRKKAVISQVWFFPIYMKKDQREMARQLNVVKHGDELVSGFWCIKGKSRHERKHSAGRGRGGRYDDRRVPGMLWRSGYAAGKPTDQVPPPPPCQLPRSSVPQSNCAISREEEMQQIGKLKLQKNLLLDTLTATVGRSPHLQSYITVCAGLVHSSESPFPPPLFLSQMWA